MDALGFLHCVFANDSAARKSRHVERNGCDWRKCWNGSGRKSLGNETAKRHDDYDELRLRERTLCIGDDLCPGNNELPDDQKPVARYGKLRAASFLERHFAQS